MTREEFEHETEQWHNGAGINQSIYEYMGISWEQYTKYVQGIFDRDLCSCGARDKAKCSKENGLGCGKMCLKEYKTEQYIREWSEDFASKQETLPAEFQQVLENHVWELYEK